MAVLTSREQAKGVFMAVLTPGEQAKGVFLSNSANSWRGNPGVPDRCPGIIKDLFPRCGELCPRAWIYISPVCCGQEVQAVPLSLPRLLGTHRFSTVALVSWSIMCSFISWREMGQISSTSK